MNKKITKSALRIFILYLVLGLSYIYVSDHMIYNFTPNPELITIYQNYKGWFFILTTAIIFFYLVNREIRNKTKLIHSLNETNEEIKNVNSKLQNNIVRINEINIELEEAKNKAQENDKLKTAFLNNLSHEIRTPLNGLIGFSNLMVQEDIDPDTKIKFKRIIRSSSEQLLHIIDDLFDISRLETGQLRVVHEKFNLIESIYFVYHLLKNEIEESGKDIRLIFKNDISNNPFNIYSDKKRIVQILTKLAINALKFTAKGEIEIGLKKTENGIKIYFKDSGIGIPPEKQKIIFERFRQVDDETSRFYSGTGLGLSISRGIAYLLGGDILLEGSTPSGSLFSFILAVDEPTNDNPDHKAASNERKNNASIAFKNKTILIAEDSTENYELMFEYLKNSGNHLVWAKNGIDAVDTVKNNTNIDLVLMDIALPIMDGTSAYKIIKEIRPALPVIAVTANALIGDRQKYINNGFNDYVAKPVSRKNLIFILNKWI